MTHKFALGQQVILIPRTLQVAARGAYEVRRLMPEAESDGSNPVYRIKSLDEVYERVARESELTPSISIDAATASHFAADMDRTRT